MNVAFSKTLLVHALNRDKYFDLSIDRSQEQIDYKDAVDCKNEDRKRNYSCLTQNERNNHMGCQVLKAICLK